MHRTIVKFLLLLYTLHFTDSKSSDIELLFGKWQLTNVSSQPMNKGTNADTVSVQNIEQDMRMYRTPPIITFFPADSFRCDEPIISIDMGEKHFKGTHGYWNLDTANKTLLLAFTKDIKVLFLVKKLNEKGMELIFIGQHSFNALPDKLNDNYVKFTFNKI